MTKPWVALAAGLSLISQCLADDSSSQEPCGQIGAIASDSSSDKPLTVPATLALACLQSVPIDKDAATQFVKYLNASLLQFQSTSAYLKDPPSTYQQPAVDLQAGLENILTKITTGPSGMYTNEYDFEFDVWNLTRAAHDGHLSIGTGGLSALMFTGPFALTSVSRNGQSMPDLYSYTDLHLTVSGRASGWAASPLQTINGQDANAWVQQFAANFSTGSLESHTDWNMLMYSPISLINDVTPNFSPQYVFPGEWFNATFANGTSIQEPFVAGVPVGSFANISSGQDFYNTFVLPKKVSTADSDSTPTTNANTSAALDKWPVSAFPSPDLVTPNFGGSFLKASGGSAGSSVSGYTLNESSVAVMSIPSFVIYGQDLLGFVAFINMFISKAQQGGIKHILIDVQGNPGGDPTVATEVFKHFFPADYPYLPERMRVHEGMNILGSAASSFAAVNESDLDYFASSPWAAQWVLHADTRKPFASWSDVTNGYQQKGDSFTASMIEDFNSTLNVDVGAGFDNPGVGAYAVDGFGNAINTTQPYDASDIVILTNGNCHSTCTVFTELMHHLKGVRIATVGGLPKPGQMQGVAGVRGSQSYEIEGLVHDIHLAQNMSVDIGVLSDVLNSGIAVDGGSFNLKDQLRENDTFPLQFGYEAADCRLFFTQDTFNNMTAFWDYVAGAMWGNSGMCVQGSTQSKANALPGATGGSAQGGSGGSGGSGNSGQPAAHNGSAGPLRTSLTALFVIVVAAVLT